MRVLQSDLFPHRFLLVSERTHVSMSRQLLPSITQPLLLLYSTSAHGRFSFHLFLISKYHDSWIKIYLNKPVLEKSFALVLSSHFRDCRWILCRCRLVAFFMRAYFHCYYPEATINHKTSMASSHLCPPSPIGLLVTWHRPCLGVGWQPCQPLHALG